MGYDAPTTKTLVVRFGGMICGSFKADFNESGNESLIDDGDVDF